MTNGRCGSALLLDPGSAADVPTAPSDLRDVKRRLRQMGKARRTALPPDERAAAATAIADRVLDALDVDALDAPAGTLWAGYAAVGAEADVMPLLLRLAARHHALALPAVVGRDRPLVFRAWAPADDLVPGRYGIPCPPESAAPCRPAVVLVPLVAFDRRGGRLGHGAGYYDRTLEALRRHTPVTAIGIAFAVQEMPKVPTDDHDQLLDWIVTERDAISVGNRSFLAIESR